MRWAASVEQGSEHQLVPGDHLLGVKESGRVRGRQYLQLELRRIELCFIELKGAFGRVRVVHGKLPPYLGEPQPCMVELLVEAFGLVCSE